MLPQRYLTIRIAALLIGLGAIVPGSSSGVPSSSGEDRRLTDALEQALPSLVSSGDYWTASRLSFQLAAAHSRLNETTAACDALSLSLAYYRKSVAEPPLHEVTFGQADGDEGLREIRSRFGCSIAQVG